MAARIERATVRYPLRFVVAGDSGAWPDPTADGIFAQLLDQVAALDPPPLFFANLGDFAGPGTRARHEHYLHLAERLPVPDLCVVGNHDLDDPGGETAFAEIHGPAELDFTYGHTRFVVIRAAPGTPGRIEIPAGAVEGARAEDLAFLDERLRAAQEPHRVVLMHMPPKTVPSQAACCRRSAERPRGSSRRRGRARRRGSGRARAPRRRTRGRAAPGASGGT